MPAALRALPAERPGRPVRDNASMTASDTPPARVRPTLEYPFEEPPPPGEAIEVAPGVLWIRMPLPFTLSHINLWALSLIHI